MEARNQIAEKHVLLRSIDSHGFGAGEIDALDAGRSGEPRDILRKPAPLYAFLQVFGNPVGHEFERQFAAFVLAIKPDDVETVACRDRLRADCARLEGKQGRFEFGRGLAGA